MSTSTFSTALKKRFSSLEWPWLLLALRQDPVVWHTLQKTDLGQRTLEELPALANAWSPAAISLLALNTSVSVDYLRATPLQPLEEDLLQRVSQVFDDWSRQPENPSNMEDAGLLALTFREQFRASGDWQETIQSASVTPDTCQTVFVCLYDMLPQPAGLLRSLMNTRDGSWINLAVHIVLANPNLPEFQLALLNELLIDLDPASVLQALQALTSYRPGMATLLARQLLTKSSDSWRASFNKTSDNDGFEQLEKLLQTFRITQMRQIAGQAEMAVPVLSDGLRMIRKVRGHLSAQLAYSVAQTKDNEVDGWAHTAGEASIEAWKQAIQLSPDQPRYVSGYGKALLKMGRDKEAEVYLKSYLEKTENPTHPELLLTLALAADQTGDHDVSLNAALKSLELVETSGMISEPDFVTLSTYLFKENELESALQATRLGLLHYPVSKDLLALKARINFSTCQPEGAIEAVYAAQAAKNYEVALLQPESDQTKVTDEPGWQPSWLKSTQDLPVQKILVESLESLGIWDAAYDERVVFLDGKDEITTQDLRELATCAKGAHKFEKVIEICQQLLQGDPSDLSSHQHLAEAAEALQNYETAIEHFNWGVRLAPDKGDLWKGLYKSQRMAGQETAAFDTLRAASQALPNDPEIQFQLGELYLEQGAPTLALPYLKKAYSSSEGQQVTIPLATRLGETLCQLGQLDEARQVLEPVYDHMIERVENPADAVNNITTKTDYYNKLATVYARAMLSLGEPEKAVPILSRVVRDRPDDPEACLDLSKGLMMLSDRASGARRAIPFLQRLLMISPDGVEGGYSGKLDNSSELLAEARLLLAEAYAANGEWEKAMDGFRLALDEPGNQTKDMQTRLSVGLGMTALKLDLPEMAVAALQDAAHSEPLNDRIQKNLCEAYISNGLSKDAFEAAQAALNLAPSDSEMLGWFIDQGMKIAEMPGAATQNITERVISALRTALSQSPERADLIIRLGDLLVRTGNRAEAIEVFRKLASLETSLQKVGISQLYKAGLGVLEAGDARLAVILLRKAIDLLEASAVSGNLATDGVSLIDFYEALIKALEQLGDFDGALDALARALDIDKTREMLYTLKADILLKLGQNDAAKTTLELALKSWPNSPGLLYRSGKVLRAMGDLTGALHQAELGITVMEEEGDLTYHRDLYYLAAKLARATLRPRRAFAHLRKAIAQTDPDYNHLDNAMLRAEYALEAGEEQAAMQAASIFASQANTSPRLLADLGRLDYLAKDRTEGDKKCRSAVRLWTRLQMDQPGQKPASTKEEFMSELVVLGSAALEARMWKDGLSIFRQMVEMFPEEPLAHFLLAQALMFCSEAQALCQDFEVVNNAPGKQALLEAAWKEFEDNLKIAAAQLGCEELLNDVENKLEVDVEIKRAIGITFYRGHAVFIPNLQTASTLETLLQMITPLTEDLVSLITVYRRCGAKERAVKAADTGWRPVFDGKDIRKDQQVVIQLALTDDDLGEAREAVLSVLSSTELSGLIWPEPVMLQFLLARFDYQLQDYQLAWENIQKALAEWPDEARWQSLAAAIQLALPGDHHTMKVNQAIGLMERAAGLEPDNDRHQLSLGILYLESGQPKKALSPLEQAVHLNPSNGVAWFELSKAQNLAGDLERASTSADRSIEITPNNPDALLLRSELALKTRNFRGALSRAQSVLHLQPEQPKALILMAKALEGLDRSSEALNALEKAMQANGNPIEMQLERLNLIKRSQGLEAGLKVLQDLVSQNPKQAAYLALLADWLLQVGKQDAAVHAARLALQDGLEGLGDREKADLHLMIGLYMQKTGQLDQAIHHLSEAIAVSPDYVDAYLALGRVYQERRETQQALKTYQKAINFGSGDYRPYYHAGVVLKDNKDYMAAEAMLRRASQLAPNEVSVYRMLGAVVALNLVHGRRLVSDKSKNE